MPEDVSIFAKQNEIRQKKKNQLPSNYQVQGTAFLG